MFDRRRRDPTPIVALAAIVILAIACDAPRTALPLARPVEPIVAERIPAPPPGKLPEKKRRFREPVVYLDGQLAAVLRHSELPLGFEPRMKKLLDGRKVPRYALRSYLRAVGIDDKRIRGVHFHGGRDRVSVVDGESFAKFGDKIDLSFTRANRGKARVEWPGDGFEVNTTIDIVQALAVYVDKEPPAYDKKTRALVLDGKRVEGVAYVPEEELKGTRFYADGKLVTAMKRKTLPDAILADDSDPRKPTFSLAKYVSSIGVDPARVRAADFLAGDDVIARVSNWQRAERRLVFVIPRRSQGKIAMRLEGDFAQVHAESPKDVEPRVSAIALYLSAAPPPRDVAPWQVPSPEGDGGSGKAQGNDENAGEND